MKLMRVRYALWLCVLATPAAAQEDTGNYMLPYCQALVQGKPGDVGMAGVCAGTISALVYVGHALPGAVRFCPPRNTPNINVLSWLTWNGTRSRYT